MNAYSKDLRLKVLCAVERGVPRKEVAGLLGISVSTRTRETLVEATGRALDAITLEDIRGSYTDCGYRLPLQPL